MHSITSKYRQWMPYILVMAWVARNTLFRRGRTGEYYSVVDTMAMLQIGIVAAIILFLLTTPLRAFWRQIKTSSLKFYFLYYAFAALSALWSINPMFSFYRAIEVLALSSAVIYFCVNTSGLEESIRRVQLMLWSALLVGALGAALHTGFSLTLRSNGLGATAAMTACFFVAWALATHGRKDRTLWSQGSVGIFVVLSSMSLASWWSFWFGLSYCSMLIRKKALILFLVLLGAGFFFSLSPDVRHSLLLRDKDSENLEKMTGRTILWKDYMAASSDRPWLGFGFAMGAREVGRIYTTTTHNAFYGALLGMGWVGVGCWVLLALTLIRELLRYRHAFHPAWLGCAAALAAGALNSMSLSIVAEQWIPSTTVFVALLALHLSYLKQQKSSSRVKANEVTGPRRLQSAQARVGVQF